MSEVFGIDIVIHPDVAAGKAAVVKSLEEIQTRGAVASRGVGDAFRQLHRSCLFRACAVRCRSGRSARLHAHARSQMINALPMRLRR